MAILGSTDLWVKICGTTSVADARLAVAAGADAVGFVFAGGPRHVEAEQVAAITAQMPDDVERVGVFTEPDAKSIVAAVRRAGLTAVQLHMVPEAGFYGRLRERLSVEVKLIQVLFWSVDEEGRGVDVGGMEDQLRAAFGEPELFAVLLDASRAGRSGGLGVRFDWAAAEPVIEAVRSRLAGEHTGRLILAGGLNPENVAQAVATLRPWGVDVVSGVEEQPRVKSADRLKAFLENARSDR